MDQLLVNGRLVDAIPDERLLALASAVAANAARERIRGRRRSLAGLGAGESAEISASSDPATTALAIEAAEIGRARCSTLLDGLLPVDVNILGLRLRGSDWPSIAHDLGMTPAAVHRRYFRAIRTLADLKEGTFGPS